MCPKVICLVPSLTETFLECGVEVIGRTQFCIHPAEKVSSIPVVGGTKKAFWSRTTNLMADFVIMDREENTLEMAQSSPFPVVDVHIISLQSAADEFHRLAQLLKNKKLADIGDRYQRIAKSPSETRDILQLPGVLRWLRTPTAVVEKIIYVIWKNPWMRVHRDCYIGDVLAKFGVQVEVHGRYPEFLDSELQRASHLLLFSSEPYPFLREEQQLLKSGNAAMALVDGESFSWFGIRSLQFLEKTRQS